MTAWTDPLTADERAAWTKRAYRLGTIGLALREQGCELNAEAFHGECLRLMLAEPGSGWISLEESDRALDLNRKQDRANGERAQALLERERAEYARKLADIRAEFAAAIRARATEAWIPSKYRREGALIVAEWLEGGA